MRGILLLLASFAIAIAAPARSAPLDVVTNRAKVLYYEIYDATAWAARIPYRLAKPVVIRAGLKHWLADVPLDAPVRERVEARIDSEVFVDDIVPFLLAVKETYVADEVAVPTFDTWLRRSFDEDEPVPGFEHSMFAWANTEKARAAEAGSVLDPELIAQWVTLYDRLYLGTSNAAADLSEELEVCERREDMAELKAAVARSQPIVRELIESVRSKLQLDEEIGAAIDAILSDAKRLETITATGIEFVDHLVCSSYRVFATRLLRQQQLERWLLGEFDKDSGGGLWQYLTFANEKRRYGVVIAIDGLQGHLVEAVASGNGSNPFLQEAIKQREAAKSIAPRTQRSRPAPSVREIFLDALTTTGYTHPLHLRFFRDLYRDDGAGEGLRPFGVARGGISTTPTISVRNLPMIETGATVAGKGGTGVPNFHFVDREYTHPGDPPTRPSGRPYYFFGNDAMRLRPLTRAAGMRSLFDRLPTWSSFSCASQYDDAAHYRIDSLLNLALGEAIRDFGEVLCMTELQVRAQNERRLHKLRARLLDARAELSRDVPLWRVFARSAARDQRVLARRDLEEIARLEQRALPELFIWYDPWPDHFAHFKGPFGDEILSPSGELNRLDYWLMKLTDTYREGGVFDRTLFGMSGDHGLAPVFHVLNPEVEVFDALRAQGVDFRVSKISSDEGEGPKLNSLFDPPTMRGYDVVVASTAGGNYMLDFFLDQHERWGTQPLYRELTKLHLIPKPADADPIQVDAIALILERIDESLDYLVVREEVCGVDGGEVRVIARRGTAWIERMGELIYYRYQGADLLQTDRLSPYDRLGDVERAEHARLHTRCIEEPQRDDPQSWCDEAQWRRLTSLTPRPDSVVQLAHLYDTDRAGTVNLFPKEGIGYNTQVSGRHAGESFGEKDAFVGLWGVPVTRGPSDGRLRTAVNGSIPGVIFEWLTGEPATRGTDGWGFPAIGPDVLGRALERE